MKGTIAVEEDLTPVKEYLMEKGYNVESIDLNEESPSKLQDYDAIVVTGFNSDFLGFHDTKTGAVVIDADGLTPEEVVEEIENSNSAY